MRLPSSAALAVRTLLLLALGGCATLTGNTEQMVQKLRSAGVRVETKEFDDLSHVTLIGAVAKPIRWIGGPVVPPILDFVGLTTDRGRTASIQ